MENILLSGKITSLPKNLKTQVEDFVNILSAKINCKSTRQKPVFGSAKGMFIIRPGFDDPVAHFKEYM